MPYEVRQVGDQFCVMKQGTSTRMGCHPTKEKAMAQMRALYANEADMPMKAEMSGAAIDDLPDSDFAYIEPGGTKDSEGKTVPRSLRHFPIHDAAHVRNALSRLAQSPFGEKARAKVEAAAKRMGIGGEGKATGEIKAEPMSTNRLERWLKGEIARRILVLPFGGPIPRKGAPLGVDLDGEWFDADTDIYGSFAALRESRERLVDWHHDQDPTGRMKGAILGRVELDPDPEDDGRWGDFWANAGENRRKLIAELERGDVPLYGSSEAVPGAVRKTDGHIDVWPLIRHTITTSPQNTLAVVPPLKAVLGSSLDEIPAVALKALLLGLDAPTVELLLGSREVAADPATLGRSTAAKSGRVLSKDTLAALERVLELAERELPAALRELIARGRPIEVTDD